MKALQQATSIGRKAKKAAAWAIIGLASLMVWPLVIAVGIFVALCWAFRETGLSKRHV